LKTDEALGKTGGGPEGLPDSIIVTAEGIEGAVEIAQRVEAEVPKAVEGSAADVPEQEPAAGPATGRKLKTGAAKSDAQVAGKPASRNAPGSAKSPAARGKK
ncbi:MAG TPA: hypothetical protein VLS44_09300, partial [Nitrospira sp.]|nr:hypothetical protein [Nitrospira sp.]